MTDSFHEPGFASLLNNVCDGTLDEKQLGELASILEADQAARKALIDHLALQADIRFLGRSQKICNRGLTEVRSRLLSPSSPGASFPTAGFPDGSVGGIAGLFASGWPVAYLIAAVIFGVGLLIGAIVHVSQPGQYVGPSNSAPIPNPQSPIPNPSCIVARITGMLDCVLNNDQCRMQSAELKTDIHHSAFSIQHSLVHLGDTFALRSGLLEITYDSGAKVILQGPVTYEVESPAGGYLSLGKLTAKLEKSSLPSPFGRGAGGEGGSSSLTSPNSRAANHQSEIRNPKSPDLCPLTSDLFAIRTPTAVVTDLGTEFGVEVETSGATRSHVFRGSIRVQRRAANGTGDDTGHILHENQSVRVASDRTGEIVVAQNVKPSDFIRELPRPNIKVFDLVDAVAGGDGFSGKRGCGIDPTTGHTVDEPPKEKILVGNGRYHRVDGLPFVDGVFVPDNRRRPVQTDSAGHTLDAFGNAFNETSHYIWAGGAIPADNSGRVIPTVLGGIDYGSSGHGLLYMHANKGITFDLDAIRRANPNDRLIRFRAVVGNTETADALKFRSSGTAATFFADDFQSAMADTMPTTADLKPGSPRVGKWEITDSTGTSAQIVNNIDPGSIHAGSNRYLKVVRSGPRDQVWATGWNAGETEGQIVQMSASVWVSSGSNVVATLCGFTSQASDGRSSFTVYLGANGAVEFSDGDAMVTTDLVSHPDVWQNVVVTANMATHRFSIKLDDQPLYTGGTWANGVDRVAHLFIGIVGPLKMACFDNVRLGTCSVPPEALLAKQGEPNRGLADVWVLVDGERRVGRHRSTGAAGTFPLAVPIGENDRFLTLVVTDGGYGLFWDWILFGDPRLEMAPVAVRHGPSLKSE